MLDRLHWTVHLARQMLGQARYPFRPLAAIEADRDRRVRSIVAHAYRHVPYYREIMDRMGLEPDGFRAAADLAKLPLLERSQVLRDPLYFVSRAQPLEGHLQVRSSGSTGSPCTFYLGAHALFLYAATNARSRAVWAPLVGKTAGYRKTMFLSSVSSSGRVQGFYRQHLLIPPGLRLVRQYLSLLDPPEVNVRHINQFKPDVISCYGSYLAMLFRHLRDSGKPFHRPKVLLYTSDALPDSARRLISDEFGIPVFSSYEANESYNIGFECEEHSGLHVNVDLCHVRIVDAEGRMLPTGESGEVVISNLVNRATVLLNYRLSDVAAMVPARCPCGRSLPLLTHVQGRGDDWLRLPSGELIHPQAIPSLIKYRPGIWQYQVVQETPIDFRVVLVIDDYNEREDIAQHIQQQFRGRFGEEVTVEVQFVDEIERTSAEKVRPVVSLRSADWHGVGKADARL